MTKLDFVRGDVQYTRSKDPSLATRRLVDQAAAGEEVIIARAGRPLVKLVAFSEKPRVRFGTLAGILRVPDDFDAPLPHDLLQKFEE